MRFVRRYAQRQVLCIRSSALSTDLRNLRQRHRTQARRKCRVSADRNGDSISESDFDTGVDADGEDEKEFRYASNSDVEAEHLNRLVERFRDIDLQISNLGDVALEMIQKEKIL